MHARDREEYERVNGFIPMAVGKCFDCTEPFPIHEDIYIEVRCQVCQAKWRIKKANERHSVKLQARPS